jgi:hypothetical protein
VAVVVVVSPFSRPIKGGAHDRWCFIKLRRAAVAARGVPPATSQDVAIRVLVLPSAAIAAAGTANVLRPVRC